MKIISSDLQAMAVAPTGYPKDELPEIAFVGRSNVGKSSFINAMLNRINLARTSGKPGKTRTINFYLINELFRFVDLPGYGYAQVSFTERNRWKGIIEKYLKNRNNLKVICLIVDIRHKPSEQDIEMYKWIEAYNLKTIVIATKADKISKSQWKKSTDEIKKALCDKMCDIDVVPFSSSKKINVDELWKMFDGYIS
ncbi:MAG: ribosome biogenesis GTP-binding protein YihA/YsxC [Gudongella sp.]|jgi:GTP-binding protein|nr:ribosome biogenesis GTP-binding protein YihA/YsxC [Gudongella sp.]